ncbi:MAG TPA: PAS domain S-box protein, partial [Longimicrobium sp.]|nr:PAS domain S-box protein [Longimicrobium sp.]
MRTLRLAIGWSAVLLALLLTCTALVHWRTDTLERQARSYWYRILDSNGRQTARVIELWLRERREDAAVVAGSVAAPLAEGGRGADAASLAAELEDDLNSLVNDHGFHAGWVIGPDGRAVSVSRGGGALSVDESAALERVLARRTAGTAGPWRAADGSIAYSFLAPIHSPGRELLGVVVLRSDPALTLLPTISWRLDPSETGQSRLLVAHGDSILVLSPSREPAAEPLALGTPAAAAPALWREALARDTANGVFQDLDSAPVLATTRRIAGVGWALIRTIHVDEALGSERERARTEVLLALASAVILALVAILLLRRARAAEARRTAAALRDSELRHRTLFERNPLPMLLHDADTLRIVEVNEAALTGYGHTREEFLEMRLSDLHSETGGPPPAFPAAGAGRVELGVHRHRTKDGRVIEVALISDDTPVDGRHTRLLLAQDVTRARAVERSYREAHATL